MGARTKPAGGRAGAGQRGSGAGLPRVGHPGDRLADGAVRTSSDPVASLLASRALQGLVRKSPRPRLEAAVTGTVFSHHVLSQRFKARDRAPRPPHSGLGHAWV